MTLQQFIEVNAGKILGKDKFLYQNTFIGTGITHPLQPMLVTVAVHWIGLNYTVSDKIDRKDFNGPEGEHIDFYHWLKDKFLPMAVANYTKHSATGK